LATALSGAKRERITRLHQASRNQPAQAAELYTGLVRHNLLIKDVINDVQEALYRFPVDVNLWVVLGDAFLRTDDLQEALNAYSKAEDLVR